MKRKSIHLALTAVLALGMTAACKSSGVAVTDRGQIMKINISSAEDLPENFTDEIEVEIANRGVANIHDIEFTVEIPRELVVVSENHGDGMDLMMMRTPEGRDYYHYRIGDLNGGEEAVATFQVRTQFGSLERTSDIKVTAWQEDLPSQKLVETRQIRLRR